MQVNLADLPEQGGNGRCSCNFQLEPIKRQRSSHPETPLLERSVTQTIEHTRRGFIMFFCIGGTHFESRGCLASCREAFGCIPSAAAHTVGSSVRRQMVNNFFSGFNFFLRNRLLHLDWGEHVVLQSEVPALRHCLGNPH